MTSGDEHENETPERLRRHPFGPGGMRLLSAVVAIVGGTVLAIRFAHGAPDGSDGALPFWLGIVLAAVGVIAIPVSIWMAKRGL